MSLYWFNACNTIAAIFQHNFNLNFPSKCGIWKYSWDQHNKSADKAILKTTETALRNPGQPWAIHSSLQTFKWQVLNPLFPFNLCIHMKINPILQCTRSSNTSGYLEAESRPNRDNGDHCTDAHRLSTPSDKSQPPIHTICPCISASAAPWNYYLAKGISWS